MRVHKIIEKTYAEGPGCRFCIWVQGCSHHCEGCFAVDTWDYNAGYEFSVTDILQRIEAVKKDICGITLLGGEPFDKADELSFVAEKVKSWHKTVIAFTGYTYEFLSESDNASWGRLLSCTDLLIDGKFEKDKIDYSKPLIGSSNQRFVFLTKAFTEDEIMAYENRFEIRVLGNGKITFNGMGDIDKLQKYVKKIEGANNG